MQPAFKGGSPSLSLTRACGVPRLWPGRHKGSTFRDRFDRLVLQGCGELLRLAAT